MYKILLGGGDHSVLLMILKDSDFQRFREKPLDDYVRTDCAPFGRPDVNIVLTYATNRSSARDFIHTSRFRELPGETSDRRFSGAMMDVSVVGTVFTEATLKQFESRPMQKHVILRPARTPGFTIDITYTDSERAVVGFLRGIGTPLEDIFNNPELRPLCDLYAAETVDLSLRVAAAHGITLPKDDGPVTMTMGNYDEKGMSEQVMLAVRGEEMAWFARHPTEEFYYRRAVKGEWPKEIDATWVKVMRTPDPGVRMRMPMRRDAAGNFIDCTTAPSKTVS